MNTIEFLRQFRIGNYAIFDFVVSFLGIYLLSPLLTKIFAKMKIKVPRYNWLFLTLPIGFLFHLAFGSITPMTKKIIDLNGHYIVKLIMLILLILGLRGVKIIKNN